MPFYCVFVHLVIPAGPAQPFRFQCCYPVSHRPVEEIWALSLPHSNPGVLLRAGVMTWWKRTGISQMRVLLSPSVLKLCVSCYIVQE